MENNKKRHAFGVTFTGDVTFQGPMFDIHDNEHVHISAEKMPHEELVDDQLEMATDITQLPQVEEELNYFQPQLHLKRLFAVLNLSIPENGVRVSWKLLWKASGRIISRGNGVLPEEEQP